MFQFHFIKKVFKNNTLCFINLMDGGIKFIRGSYQNVNFNFSFFKFNIKKVHHCWQWREVFSPQRSLNQPKATRVCICSINQSNRPISVGLLVLVRSRVFISRSHQNALLTAAGCNQSLIQSHAQRKRLTMVYRKNRL